MRVAKPETLSPRPAVWHRFVEQLVADGWLFDTERHEWVHGEPHEILGGVGYNVDERGRICWSADETQAWLAHPKGA